MPVAPDIAVDALLLVESRALDTARRARLLRRRIGRQLQRATLPEDQAQELATLRMEAACWEWDAEVWREVIMPGDAEK